MDRIGIVQTLEARVAAADREGAAALLVPEAEGGFAHRCAGLSPRCGVEGLRAHMEAQGRLVR